MAFDYAGAADTALELIADAGAQIPIKRVSNALNAVAGSVVATNQTGTLTAVVLPAKATANELVNGTADNRILEGLRKGKVRFILAAAKGAPFEPDANDVLTFDGFDWSAFSSVALKPAAVPVVYKIGVIRA
jgi:hypothetical protein